MSNSLPIPMFDNPFHNQSTMTIGKIILIMSGTFDNTYHRAVMPTVSEDQVNNIVANLHANNNNIALTGLANMAPGIGDISQRPGALIAVPNGMQTMRFNFVIKGEIKDSLGQTFYYEARGYTDHYAAAGWSSAGNPFNRLPHDLNWHLTAFNKYLKQENNNGTFTGLKADGLGGMVISPNALVVPGNGVSQVHMITPESAFANKVSLISDADRYFNGASSIGSVGSLGSQMNGSGNIINTANTLVGAKAINFEVANPVASIANALGTFAMGVAGAEGTSADPYLEAYSVVGQKTVDVSSTLFIANLRNKSYNAAAFHGNIFSTRDLIGFDATLASQIDQRTSVLDTSQVQSGLMVPNIGNDWQNGNNPVLCSIAQRVAFDIYNFLLTKDIQLIDVQVTNLAEDMGAAPHNNAGFGLNFHMGANPKPATLHRSVPVPSYNIGGLQGNERSMLLQTVMNGVSAYIEAYVWPYVSQQNQLAGRLEITADLTQQVIVKLNIKDVGSGHWIMPTFAISSIAPIYTEQHAVANHTRSCYNTLFNSIHSMYGQTNAEGTTGIGDDNGFMGALAGFNLRPNQNNQSPTGNGNALSFF